MARFPHREAEIKALAQSIIIGLSENPDFPSPPVSSSDLRKRLDAFVALGDTQVVALAAAEQATEAKRAGLDELISDMKAVLHYAKDVVHGNDAKLAALGWSGRATQTPLAAPGQPRSLEILQHGEGWLILDWKRPVDGGAAAVYKIERRELADGGTWTMIGMAVEHEATLNNQERGKALEYRVIAANRAGESVPSNTVAVVL